VLEREEGAVQNVSRRTFVQRLLNISLFGASAFAAGGTIYPVWRYLASPPKPELESGFERIVVTSVRGLPAGEARSFQYAGIPYLVIHDKGAVYALSAVCTHKGCLVAWDKRRGELVCPCHGSAFDVNGNVKRGPAPRPLPSLKGRIIQDQVVVGGA
jgi:Rieske Fe-S protein